MEPLILAIAKKICHCEGHVWMPHPEGYHKIRQERYRRTAYAIHQMVMDTVYQHERLPSLVKYAPPRIRSEYGA